jgi:hypothetical protein
MKTRKIFSIVAFVAMTSSLMWLSGCHDDPKPDHCMDKEEVTAKFTIGEKLFVLDTAVVSDTTISGNTVIFEASEDYDSYEWKIGQDTRTWTTKKVTLPFIYPETQLDVRLIVKRKPNKTCFPNDNGIDTLIKHLTVMDKKLNPIVGEYEGSNLSNPNDVFKIRIFYYILGDYSSLSLVGINKGCDPESNITGSKAFSVISPGYKKIYFDAAYNYNDLCKNPKGWVTLDKSGKNIKIIYSYEPNGGAGNPSKKLNDTFTGKKLN